MIRDFLAAALVITASEDSEIMYWLLWKSYFIALIQYTYARRRVDTFSFNSTSSILARQLNEHLRHSTTTNEKYYRTLTVESHRVRNLPGLDPLIASRLVHYAGYLPVDDSGQGNLFYWLFEADKNPEQGMTSPKNIIKPV